MASSIVRIGGCRFSVLYSITACFAAI
uniref:ALDO1 n=1 Tax=Arundo donax TaxID=35708 RepID=A0A0A8ZH08_ARUDO